MSTNPRVQTAQSLIEIKGGSFVVPVIRLLDTDTLAVSAEIAEKVAQAPDFFNNAPVVLDLKELSDQQQTCDLPGLVKAVKALGMTVIGIRSGTDSDSSTARSLGLALMPEGRPEKKSTTTTASNPAPPADSNGESVQAIEQEAPAISQSITVTQPIRSGQRVYSPGDLIILAQVSNGAEIMADGNIHVYGTLRGRALAGVRGDTDSRIFCKDLQAELISIAGNYRISENLTESVRNKPVQIYLDNDALIIDDI